MLRKEMVRKFVLRAGVLGIAVLMLQGLLAPTAEAEEANRAKVVIGTYDEEAAFRKHPAYGELVKAHQATQEAQQQKDGKAFQKAHKEFEQKQQQVSERFQADLAEALPQAAAAAGVDVIAVQLVYANDKVERKDITPLLVQTFAGEEFQGALPKQSGNTEAEIGTYDPQKVFQKHPRYKELVTAMMVVRKAQEDGDQNTAMEAQRAFEQKRVEIGQEYQKDVSEVLPDAAEAAGVDAIAIQVPFTSEDTEPRDVTPTLSKALAKHDDSGADTDKGASGFPGLR